MRTQLVLLATLALSLLAGCPNNNNSVSTHAQGVFVDAPVEGLTFVNDGITGTTDSDGKFTYRIGTTVTFSINGVQLPAVQGASMLTPVDLVGFFI